MKAIRRLDQYLRLRGDIWHYVRRVPKEAKQAGLRGHPARHIPVSGAPRRASILGRSAEQAAPR